MYSKEAIIYLITATCFCHQLKNLDTETTYLVELLRIPTAQTRLLFLRLMRTGDAQTRAKGGERGKGHVSPSPPSLSLVAEWRSWRVCYMGGGGDAHDFSIRKLAWIRVRHVECNHEKNQKQMRTWRTKPGRLGQLVKSYNEQCPKRAFCPRWVVIGSLGDKGKQVRVKLDIGRELLDR